jgi:hypothetical protein
MVLRSLEDWKVVLAEQSVSFFREVLALPIRNEPANET